MNYELRPLSLAEILDAAFRLVQTEWKTLIGLSLIMQIPIAILASRASWLFDPFAQPFELGEEPSTDMLIEMGLIGGGMGLAYLIEIKNKAGRNRFTPAQIDYYAAVRCPVYVIRSVNDVELLFKQQLEPINGRSNPKKARTVHD